MFAHRCLLGIALATVSALGPWTHCPAQDEYQIELRSRTFTPSAEASLQESANKMWQDDAADGQRHVIVQFDKKLTAEDHQRLRAAGIVLHSPLGGNAYEATVPNLKAAPQDLGDSLPFRALAPFQPEDKLSDSLRSGEPLDFARQADDGQLSLLVSFFPDVAAEQVTAALGEAEVEGRRHGADNSWEVKVSEQQAGQLAELDIVRFIEEGPLPFMELNDQARNGANTNSAQRPDFSSPLPQYRRVSGLKVRIGICEGGGFDENHDDFKTVAADGGPGVSRVYRSISAGGSHGTHVASIAGGSGVNSDPNGRPAFSLRGHAPEADLGDYTSFGGDADLFHEAIVDEQTDVTNHSYVQTANGGYNTRAASLDLIVRGDATDSNGDTIPPRPQVWAAGNNGTSRQYGNMVGFYATFTSAKNTISVGSLDTFGTRISDFSSLGPTYDGRVKPDIVAFGCNDSIASPSDGIVAARNNTQGYTTMCGTSMAAPLVSGVIALMRHQHLQETRSHFMRPSTYKAMLVHSAGDMVKLADYPDREFDNPDTDDNLRFHAGPDYVSGYGVVDAEAACDLVAATNQWRESTLASTGSHHRYCVHVPDGADELKVVIAWDDEAGSTLTAETVSKLVNDLDLVLLDPRGNEFKPWVLDPLPAEASPGTTGNDPISTSDLKPARRDADHRNNVEMVSVCRPAAGVWTIRISAFDLPTGNPQPYSLVSSSPIRTCLPRICSIAPWICRPPFDPPFWWIDDRFIINPRVPVPVDLICRYVLDCPGCRQGLCPGWDMIIAGVPRDTFVQVASSHRGIIDRVEVAEDGIAKIRVKEPAIDEQLVLLFTKRGQTSEPLEKPFPVKITFKPLDERAAPVASTDPSATDPSPGSDDDKNVIQLKSRTIQIGDQKIEPELSKALADAKQPVHGITVLSRRLEPADRRALQQMGVELGVYLGGNAYEAAFKPDGQLAEKSAADDLIRWAGTLQPEDKVDPSLWRGEPEDWVKTESGRLKVLVAFQQNVEDAEAKKMLSELGGEPRLQSEQSRVWATQLELGEIKELAKRNEVRSIEPGPHPSKPLGLGCCGN